MSSLLTRLTRNLLKTGRWHGPAGAPGRWAGRRLGAPMACGLRMLIDDPREYIQRHVIAHGVYEPEMTSLFQRVLEKDDVFFDIGGNIGNHSLVAASCGARVFAFEPVPRLAERIRANAAFNGLADRVTVINAAAGPAPGTASLNVARRVDDGSHSLISGVAADSVEKIDVPIVRVDAHAREHNTGTPAVMKIDVEGFEARVLDGASGLLDARPRPVVFIETGDRLAEQIGESARSVLDRLVTRGYRLYPVPVGAQVLQEISPADIPGELTNFLAVHDESPKRTRLADVLRGPPNPHE